MNLIARKPVLKMFVSMAKEISQSHTADQHMHCEKRHRAQTGTNFVTSTGNSQTDSLAIEINIYVLDVKLSGLFLHSGF